MTQIEQPTRAARDEDTKPGKPYARPVLTQFGDIRTRTLAPTKAPSAESGQVEPRRAGF